jgi:VanZ family protein
VQSPYFYKKTALKNSFKLFIPAIIWFAISFWLLTIPGTALPQITWFDKYQGDKAVHIFMFALICFLFSFPLKNSIQKNKWIILITVLGLLYGIAMEFVQKYFIPFRSCDVDDMIADGIGCLTGLWFTKKYFKRNDKRLKKAVEQL